MKVKGYGRLQRAFEEYTAEYIDGAHDLLCPYYFAGKNGCTIRRAQQLIRIYKNRGKIP